MLKVNFENLLEVGVYFGYLKRKWNLVMVLYIFDEKKGIYIIDFNKIIVYFDQVCVVMKQIVKLGKKVFFVVIKK